MMPNRVFTEELAKQYTHSRSRNTRGNLEVFMHGMIMEFSEIGSLFISVNSGSGRIEIGQLVEGINRHTGLNGVGIVIAIYQPSSGGLTSDIVSVHFEGNLIPIEMKPWKLKPLKKEKPHEN